MLGALVPILAILISPAGRVGQATTVPDPGL
jgi:hypothetical protein